MMLLNESGKQGFAAPISLQVIPGLQSMFHRPDLG